MYLLLIKFRLPVLSSGCEGLAVLVPVEGEETDAEAEGVEHLVLHRGQQDLQLLGLHRDRAGAEVGVTSDGPAVHSWLLSANSLFVRNFEKSW